MMKRLLTIATMVLLFPLQVGALDNPALNTNLARDWAIQARGGYGWLSDNGLDLEGFSLGVSGGYRLYEDLFAKLDVEYSDFSWAGEERARYLPLSAGLEYGIDLTPIVPYVGLSAGPLFRAVDSNDWKTKWFWQLAGGLDGIITPDFAVGIEARYHGDLENFSQNSLYVTLAVKTIYRF